MRVLVIGSGGREHALVRALSLSLSVTEVHCIPGSDGIARESVCHNVDLKNKEKVLQLVKMNSFDLIVFGPEQPLADGLSDFLREHGFKVFGPSQEAAKFESSKSYCKDFFIRHAIPTAKSYVVKSVEETMKYAETFSAPYVLKADGLAAGKGVLICQSLDELKAGSEDFFVKKLLGSSGETAVLEEFLDGWELSYLILTNGKEYRALPLAQDHKRLLDRDRGPNTGGMGAIAPIKIAETLETQIQNKILKPIMGGFIQDHVDYRGVLYVGIMVTADGPKVLEFNVRFGDPEAQVILPLLDGDWGEVFLEVAQGRLPDLRWKKNLYSACVVLASEGYPDAPKKDVVIEGNLFKQTSSSYLLHAGTRYNEEGKWVTSGGRVMNSIGLGNSPAEALKQAYALIEFSKWPGMQFRRDIGEKVLTSSNLS